MQTAAPTLSRFLAAVRRRAVLLRVLERSALGLLGGLLLAMLLVGGLWLAERPVAGVLPLAAGLGLVAGLIWAVSRLPSLLDAAMLADQQLSLDDLLGTAAAMLHGPASADPWAVTIVQIADARCRTLRPRDLVLRRLGVRVWGGIGLAMALAITLTALAGSAAISHAADATNTAGITAPPAVDRPLMVLADQGIRVKSSASASGEDPTDASRNSAEQPAAAGPATQKSPANNQNSAGQGASTGTDNGGASGFGQTKTPGTNPSTPNAITDAATRPATGNTGTAAAAGTGSNQAAGPATRDIGRTAAGNTGLAPIPPWQSADWAQDVRAAREQLDAGRVPPAYRDLVRKYFDGR